MEDEMDVHTQREIAYEVIRAVVIQLIANGQTPDVIIDRFVKDTGSEGLKASVFDDTLRIFMTAVIAQIKKDDAVAFERRLGM
jgi:hypothetical protein